MAEPNAAIARRALEAASRVPRPDFETVNELFHAEHVLVDHVYDSLEGERSWAGADGFREHTSMTHEAYTWSGFDIQSERMIDADRVLLTVRVSGKGVQSEAPFEAERGFLVTVRNGRVIRTEIHASAAAALEAAGVAE